MCVHQSCALACALKPASASATPSWRDIPVQPERLAIQITTDKHHAVDAKLGLAHAVSCEDRLICSHALEDKLGVALALKAQDAL